MSTEYSLGPEARNMAEIGLTLIAGGIGIGTVGILFGVVMPRSTPFILMGILAVLAGFVCGGVARFRY